MAVVAERGDDCAVDGLVQIGVIEHDEGGVPAQLQGDFLDVLGTFGHQLAPDFGRAREVQFAHDSVAVNSPPMSTALPHLMLVSHEVPSLTFLFMIIGKVHLL